MRSVHHIKYVAKPPLLFSIITTTPSLTEISPLSAPGTHTSLVIPSTSSYLPLVYCNRLLCPRNVLLQPLRLPGRNESPKHRLPRPLLRLSAKAPVALLFRP